MKYRIFNKTKGFEISPNAGLASNIFTRFLGLMFKKSFGKDQALVFYRAPSIHTCFMRFPLDIVFLNKEMKVIKIVQDLRAWRAVNCFGSFVTIEFLAGKARDCGLEAGDILEILQDRP